MNILFSAWGYDVSVFEFLASLTSLIGVGLGVTGARITWPWWVISSAMYGYLFLQWDLLASAALQLVFIAAGIWGWFGWGPKGAIPNKLSAKHRGLWTIGLLVSWLICIPIFANLGAAATWSDTFLLVGSIFAQVLMVLEKYEAWPLWFAIDLLGTLQYAILGLYFTSVVYAAFTAVAIVGWREWQRKAALHQVDDLTTLQR
ncbi:MAG: hypothetical protein RIS75_950 [Actinomycetota bacterium]|jgi:nicotinamide mononucleotide transporter